MKNNESQKSWPADGIESIDKCPACQSAKRTIEHEQLEDKLFSSPSGPWSLQRCTGCRTAYLNPRPNRDSIGLAYSTYYTHAGVWRNDPTNLSRTKRLLRMFSNGYLNRRFGTRYPDASSIGYFLAHISATRRATLENVGRHLPRPNPGSRLLDIGCGNGMFLKFARDAGWRTFGADPDSVAVEYCRKQGLDVRKGGVEVFSDCYSTFDVVTLSHVIEHVHDPLNLLRSCFALLKPRGILWIETPNIDSFGYRFYGSNWRGLEPPRHLVLFNYDSLGSSLTRTGFEQIQFLRPKLSFDILAKSQAITDNRDPYAAENAASLHRALKIAKKADTNSKKNPRESELITAIASRP